MSLATKNLLPFFLILLFVVLVSGQKSEAEINYLNNGNNFARNGEYDKAIVEYDKAIALNGKSAEAFYFRGAAKFLKQDTDGAIADLSKVIELIPKAGDIDKVYNFRGIIFERKGNKKAALADYDKAILINPNNPDPYNGRGNIFTDWGNLNAALTNYSKSIELNPKTPAPYIGRADVLFLKGLLDKSLLDYNKAIEINPSAAEALINRGKIYGLKGNWVKSVDDLKKGIEINSQSKSPFSGNIKVTLSDLDTFILKNPGNANSFAVRGFIKLLQGKEIEANQDFKRSFELNPKLKSELERFIEAVKQSKKQ